MMHRISFGFTIFQRKSEMIFGELEYMFLNCMSVMLQRFRMLLLSDFGNSLKRYKTAMILHTGRKEAIVVKLHDVLLGMVEPLAAHQAVFVGTLTEYLE